MNRAFSAGLGITHIPGAVPQAGMNTEPLALGHRTRCPMGAQAGGPGFRRTRGSSAHRIRISLGGSKPLLFPTQFADGKTAPSGPRASAKTVVRA
jgi:hypothetical protein